MTQGVTRKKSFFLKINPDNVSNWEFGGSGNKQEGEYLEGYGASRDHTLLETNMDGIGSMPFPAITTLTFHVVPDLYKLFRLNLRLKTNQTTGKFPIFTDC